MPFFDENRHLSGERTLLCCEISDFSPVPGCRLGIPGGGRRRRRRLPEPLTPIIRRGFFRSQLTLSCRVHPQRLPCVSLRVCPSRTSMLLP